MPVELPEVRRRTHRRAHQVTFDQRRVRRAQPSEIGLHHGLAEQDRVEVRQRAGPAGDLRGALQDPELGAIVPGDHAGGDSEHVSGQQYVVRDVRRQQQGLCLSQVRCCFLVASVREHGITDEQSSGEWVGVRYPGVSQRGFGDLLRCRVADQVLGRYSMQEGPQQRLTSQLRRLLTEGRCRREAHSGGTGRAAGLAQYAGRTGPHHQCPAPVRIRHRFGSDAVQK